LALMGEGPAVMVAPTPRSGPGVSMRQRKHALSGAVYDVHDDGNLTASKR